jgi:glycosyltransferase involved in cell wall biosynthesis
VSPQKHIVHLVTSDGFAGVERYVLGSALTLRAAGFRVTVIGGARSAMRPPLETGGVTWLPGDGMREAARSLLGVRDADLIDSHMTEADLVAVVLGGIRRIPVVSTRHFASSRGSTGLARAAGRWVGRRVAAQIAISRFVADNIDGPSEVIYTGVDAVPDVAAGSRERTVLLLQRLEPEKATGDAIRSWARVPDRLGWRLLIAGDGSSRKQLEALAAELGVAADVEFLGFRADSQALLTSAGILLAPTPHEGLGISVIEAMAAGTPVVASAAGGHLETVGTVDGAALYPPGDEDAAARVLDRLLRDPEERERYGAALRERQRGAFTREQQTASTAEVFAAVLARRGAR